MDLLTIYSSYYAILHLTIIHGLVYPFRERLGEEVVYVRQTRAARHTFHRNARDVLGSFHILSKRGKSKKKAKRGSRKRELLRTEDAKFATKWTDGYFRIIFVRQQSVFKRITGDDGESLGVVV